MDDVFELLAKIEGQGDALIVCLASIGGSATVAEIKNRAMQAGIPKVAKWNLSAVLGRAHSLTRRVDGTWKLTKAGWKRASELGLNPSSHVVFDTDRLLAATIASITNLDRRHFLEEAHKCFGAGLGRAAVVLSWVGAVWILQSEVVHRNLAAFNTAGVSRFNRTKAVFREIRTIEDFGRIGESDLLQLLEDIGFLGKSLHKQLRDRLDFRNGCGHPNSMVVDPHTVASHIHFLCNNVYLKYN